MAKKTSWRMGLRVFRLTTNTHLILGGIMKQEKTVRCYAVDNGGEDLYYLLPCPFCGGEPKIFDDGSFPQDAEHDEDGPVSPSQYWIECWECGCKLFGGDDFDDFSTEQEAANRWNKRA
jgi:hypothetical protein